MPKFEPPRTIYLAQKNLDTSNFNWDKYKEDVAEYGMLEVVHGEMDWLLDTGAALPEPKGEFVYPLTEDAVADIVQEVVQDEFYGRISGNPINS